MVNAGRMQGHPPWSMLNAMSESPPISEAADKPTELSAPPTVPHEQAEAQAHEPPAAAVEAAPAVEPAPAAEASLTVEPAPAVEAAPVVEPVAPPPAASSAADAEATSAPAAPAAAEVGVLLVNLGTPDAPERKAVRRYLKQFLTDPRVIEKNGVFWNLLLNGVILPLRSRRRARDYQKIWNNDKNESPIKTVTRSQAQKLAGILEPLGKRIAVEWAMRYANPSIASGLKALLARGCDRILVMPLYPQYSAATTATVNDEVFRYVMRLRRQPALRILPAYYDDPYYIEVLASSLKAELKALPFAPDVIIASYHGMPKEYVLKGDPYESQCVRTTELLRQQLGLDEQKFMMTFQSRFGRSRWLAPYTIKTVKALAKRGVKNLVVLTPGFSADCLETLEEIALEGRGRAVMGCRHHRG